MCSGKGLGTDNKVPSLFALKGDVWISIYTTDRLWNLNVVLCRDGKHLHMLYQSEKQGVISPIDSRNKTTKTPAQKLRCPENYNQDSEEKYGRVQIKLS